MFRYIALFLAAFAWQAPPPAVAQQVPQSVQQMQLSFAPLVRKTSPSVVNIYAKRVVREQVFMPFMNDPFFGNFGFNFGGPMRDRVENSLGSGVIVSNDGRIATNTHVIKGATEISVITSDGRELDAEIVLSDDKTDLAIIKVSQGGAGLPALPLADSDSLQVGDLVLAIGNPFGVGQTVTSGIISGLARTGVGRTDYGYYIQTDAAINPGNSGGALIDMQGRLIGVNSMIVSKSGGSLGIGFAIPVNMLKIVLAAADTGGKIVRPWLGLQGQPVTPDMIAALGLSRAQGALVNRVNPNGPAARAGIKTGDVILSVNGQEVQNYEALKFRLATLSVGAKAKLVLLRSGKKRDLDMTLEAPPEMPPREETPLAGRSPLSGATVANINPAVSEELGGAHQETGVVVMGVSGGNAARLGLARGDMIVSINRQNVGSVKELLQALNSSSSRRWLITVLRGKQVMNLMITI